jgi:hypothetical protein
MRLLGFFLKELLEGHRPQPPSSIMAEVAGLPRLLQRKSGDFRCD